MGLEPMKACLEGRSNSRYATPALVLREGIEPSSFGYRPNLASRAP